VDFTTIGKLGIGRILFEEMRFFDSLSSSINFSFLKKVMTTHRSVGLQMVVDLI